MATPKLGKGLGRKPDAPDKRDSHVPRLAHLGISAPLPNSADVFAGLNLPVYDQGSLGSCTANAGVLYRRFLAQRFAQYSALDENLSRLFLYYQERLLPWNDDPDQDGGAAIRDIFYTLAHTGVCLEADDPYVPEEFASAQANDSPTDLADASRYKIGAYHRVPDVDTARSCLASGYGVALGFAVYESFESIGADGVMPLPRAGEQVLGGHAVVICGYDDGISRFKIQNSWGARWGASGYFWMPYAFLANDELSQFDMWMGHLGAPWGASRQ